MKKGVFIDKPFGFLLKVLLPVCLGVCATVFLYYREFSQGKISSFPFTTMDLVAISVGILFIGMKDFAFTTRFRLMCKPIPLSWLGAIRTNYLCEFTSAVTPSAVGGSVLIMAYLHREGITVGRSTAVMISSLFLDELLFVLVCPLCLLMISSNELFGLPTGLSSGLKCTFAIVYIIVAAYTFLLYFTLFKKQHLIRKVLLYIVKLPFLHRFESSVLKFSQDLEESGIEMKNQPMLFWLKAFVITAWAWMSRYAVACALFFPFIPFKKEILVFLRQLVLWIVMLIAPTPGGSGVSEYLFSQYYSDLSVTASEILFITCFWRILTYYIYLLIGFCILPSWMKKSKQTIR